MKQILKKQVGSMWTESTIGSYVHGNEPWDAIKSGKMT
jgi:hypothetical protein